MRQPAIVAGFAGVCSLLMAFGLSVNAARATEPILIDGVAAYVNSEVITISEALSAMEPVRRQLVQAYSGRELRQRLNDAYLQAVNAAIDRQLVIALYEEGEARLPEWLVDQRAEAFIRDTFDGDRTALLKALAEERITYDDWKQRMEEQLIVASMRGSSVESHAVVSPEAVRRYYDEHAGEFTLTESVHVGMIMIVKEDPETRDASRAAAKAARDRVIGGEEFESVARDVSAGTNADAGGDWGWISPGKLRPKLADAVKTLKAGEVSEVIETEGELYVLRVKDRRDAKRTPFSDAQPGIERKLKREVAESLYRKWVERLRRNAYIKIAETELF